MKVDMKRFGLVKDDSAHNRDKWRSLITGNHPTLPQCGKRVWFFMEYVFMTLNINEYDDEDENYNFV